MRRRSSLRPATPSGAVGWRPPPSRTCPGRRGSATASLYEAFGSKAALTERTLQDYLEQSYEQAQRLLDGAPSGLAGLRAWLDVAAASAGDCGPTRGCYAVVCAVEPAERDEQVRQR